MRKRKREKKKENQVNTGKIIRFDVVSGELKPSTDVSLEFEHKGIKLTDFLSESELLGEENLVGLESQLRANR